MNPTLYWTIAGMILIGILWLPSRMRAARNLQGSVILAIVWPILIPIGAYYAIKRYGFGRGPSEQHGEIEASLAFLVSSVLVVGLYLSTWP